MRKREKKCINRLIGQKNTTVGYKQNLISDKIKTEHRFIYIYDISIDKKFF